MVSAQTLRTNYSTLINCIHLHDPQNECLQQTSINGPPSERLLLSVITTISTCHWSHLHCSLCCCPFSLFAPLFFFLVRELKDQKLASLSRKHLSLSKVILILQVWSLALLSCIYCSRAQKSCSFSWLAFWRRPHWLPAILEGRGFWKSVCRITTPLCGFSLYCDQQGTHRYYLITKPLDLLCFYGVCIRVFMVIFLKSHSSF